MPSFPLKDRNDNVIGEVSLNDDTINLFEQGFTMDISALFRKTGNRKPILRAFTLMKRFSSVGRTTID